MPCRHYLGSTLFLVLNPNTYLPLQSAPAPHPSHSPRLPVPRKLSHPPCPTLLPHLDSHSCPPGQHNCHLPRRAASQSSQQNRVRWVLWPILFRPLRSGHSALMDAAGSQQWGSPCPLISSVPSTGPQQGSAQTWFLKFWGQYDLLRLRWILLLLFLPQDKALWLWTSVIVAFGE